MNLCEELRKISKFLETPLYFLEDILREATPDCLTEFPSLSHIVVMKNGQWSTSLVSINDLYFDYYYYYSYFSNSWEPINGSASHSALIRLCDVSLLSPAGEHGLVNCVLWNKAYSVASSIYHIMSISFAVDPFESKLIGKDAFCIDKTKINVVVKIRNSSVELPAFTLHSNSGRFFQHT